ncbi:MAG: methyltransferase domain-containing protein [Ruminococcaceae bacterium]|nr:methyltransferase domain-containing protein [Oscillospiraceae bacterium]
MEQILSCPVCASPLSCEEKRYVCPHGHSFDVAKQGYVNLLLSRGTGVHGDNALMIESRKRFLSKGYYASLADALSAKIAKYANEDTTLLDVGCGEGYYTAHLREALKGKSNRIYAFDISKDAVRATAKRCLDTTLFVASAYEVPVLNGSVDIATLFFSPFCPDELLRVLAPNGILVMAYPGVEHLWGLKQAIYDAPYKNRPEDTRIEGFTLLEEEMISKEIFLPDTETVMELFAMTPYYYKTGEKDKAKLASLPSLTTEIQFHLCVYRKNYNTEQA